VADGWSLARHGANHDVYRNATRPGVFIAVPRHKTLTPGVAASIAKAAGW
jgi:mRNA interferase HicA